jgi:hypothetical protein
LACSVASGTVRTLHLIRIGQDAGLDTWPGNRRCDWKHFTYTRRVGADRSRAAPIPQVVEDYPAAPVSLRREYIVLRILLREAPHHADGIAMGLIMELISSFDILYPGIPGVQFDGPDRNKAEEPIKAIDPQAGAFATFAFLHVELVHRTRDILRQRAFVIEGRPVNMTHEFERSMPEVCERALVHSGPIIRELCLRRYDGAREKLQDIFAGHADVRLSVTTGRHGLSLGAHQDRPANP